VPPLSDVAVLIKVRVTRDPAEPGGSGSMLAAATGNDGREWLGAGAATSPEGPYRAERGRRGR